jgi:hypothetical protein
MIYQLFLATIAFIGLSFANPGIVIAESEIREAESAAGESGGGESAGDASAAETTAGSVVPAEVQQQLDSVQNTVNTVGSQVQSVKEKGLVQTIWDNITSPFAALFQQIGQILGQIAAIFGG